MGQSFQRFTAVKVAVVPNPWISRNLKQLITTDCMKTAMFQLLLSLDISKLAQRQLTQQFIIECIYFLAEAIMLAIIWPEIVKKR